MAPPPPPADELIQIALTVRPDLVAQRLGIQRAEADVRLARAHRFADVYVLYQPYTFQDNAPIGLKSRNLMGPGRDRPVADPQPQPGGHPAAKLNVAQTQVELAALQRRVAAEVAQAERIRPDPPHRPADGERPPPRPAPVSRRHLHPVC